MRKSLQYRHEKLQLRKTYLDKINSYGFQWISTDKKYFFYRATYDSENSNVGYILESNIRDPKQWGISHM